MSYDRHNVLEKMCAAYLDNHINRDLFQQYFEVNHRQHLRPISPLIQQLRAPIMQPLATLERSLMPAGGNDVAASGQWPHAQQAPSLLATIPPTSAYDMPRSHSNSSLHSVSSGAYSTQSADQYYDSPSSASQHGHPPINDEVIDADIPSMSFNTYGQRHHSPSNDPPLVGAPPLNQISDLFSDRNARRVAPLMQAMVTTERGQMQRAATKHDNACKFTVYYVRKGLRRPSQRDKANLNDTTTLSWSRPLIQAEFSAVKIASCMSLLVNCVDVLWNNIRSQEPETYTAYESPPYEQFALLFFVQNTARIWKAYRSSEHWQRMMNAEAIHGKYKRIGLVNKAVFMKNSGVTVPYLPDDLSANVNPSNVTPSSSSLVDNEANGLDGNDMVEEDN